MTDGNRKSGDTSGLLGDLESIRTLLEQPGDGCNEPAAGFSFWLRAMAHCSSAGRTTSSRPLSNRTRGSEYGQRHPPPARSASSISS